MLGGEGSRDSQAAGGNAKLGQVKVPQNRGPDQAHMQQLERFGASGM